MSYANAPVPGYSHNRKWGVFRLINKEPVPTNRNLFNDLKAMEESFWLPNDLRKRYRNELVEILLQFEKESRNDVFDHPLIKTYLSHILIYCERLLEMTTPITAEQARRVALQLELSQFPTQDEVAEAVDWYRQNNLRAAVGPAVKLHDGTVRHVLYSPADQSYDGGRQHLPTRSWLKNPKRLFMRAIELIFKEH